MGHLIGSQSNGKPPENSALAAPGGGTSNYYVYFLTQGPTSRGVGIKSEGGGAIQNLRKNVEDMQGVAVEG